MAPKKKGKFVLHQIPEYFLSDSFKEKTGNMQSIKANDTAAGKKTIERAVQQ